MRDESFSIFGVHDVADSIGAWGLEWQEFLDCSVNLVIGGVLEFAGGFRVFGVCKVGIGVRSGFEKCVEEEFTLLLVGL